MKLSTILIALSLGLGLGSLVNAAAADNAAREVYAVCNSARLEVSGDSEERCGDLQDKYNIEFLCSERNDLPTNHCWTEIK